jgi:hypothetical protein
MEDSDALHFFDIKFIVKHHFYCSLQDDIRKTVQQHQESKDFNVKDTLIYAKYLFIAEERIRALLEAKTELDLSNLLTIYDAVFKKISGYP